MKWLFTANIIAITAYSMNALSTCSYTPAVITCTYPPVSHGADFLKLFCP